MRVRTLEIPLDDRLQASAKSIELAMQSSRTSSVRQSMCGVSIACIQLLQSPSARDPSACSPAASSSRGRLVHLAVRRLQSRNHAHPSLDADRHPETSHLIRHLPQHSLPRVLPSSRLPTPRFSRIMAHTRPLRAHCCAVSPRRLRIAISERISPVVVLQIEKYYHGRQTKSAARLPHATVIADLSKAFSIAGVRTGWMIEHDAQRRQQYWTARA